MVINGLLAIYLASSMINFKKKVLFQIGRVEGMALDSTHRLLYWTDADKGTIELISLARKIHTTVRSQLSYPRAIALNPDAGWV